MKFIDWLRTRFRHQEPSVLQDGVLPDYQDRVTFDDHEVRCVRRNGLVESVSWDDLRIVFIETTDQGPILDDVFWVLGGSSGGCVVPSEADGCQELMVRLQQLPGFDNEAVIRATQCADNNTFLCWQRSTYYLVTVITMGKVVSA
jgi:hypothetical protein